MYLSSFPVQKIKKQDTAVAGEADFLKGGKAIYHVDKVLRETGSVVDDGLHEIFVNTVIDDGTDISDLMSCFMQKEVKNSKFPVLSAEVKRLKETDGGAEAMCEVMEKYEKIAVRKDRIEKIQAMLREGFAKEVILKIGYTEDEYSEAESQVGQIHVNINSLKIKKDIKFSENCSQHMRIVL